jgi:outer membrane protein W
MKRCLLFALAALVVAPSPADAKPHRKTAKQKRADEEKRKQEEEDARTQAEADAAAADMAKQEAAAKEKEQEQEDVQEQAKPAEVEAEAAAPAPVSKEKKLYVRAGAAFVDPLAVSRELELADVTGPASLAVQNGPIEGSGATVSSATIPALIIGYRIRPRWALESVLGIPFTVKFKATGTLANESLAPMALGIPTGVPALGPDLGTAKAAPPVVTAVYDLLGHGALRPYAGAGVALLIAYDEHVTNPILLEVKEPDMNVSPAPGVVVQGGLEARLAKRIYARLDVKFIGLMLAHATVSHIQVKTPELPLFDTVEVGTAKMSVWVNPLIVQAGLGTDF